MIISFGNKINSVRYKSWLAVSILVLSTLFTGIGAFFPTQTANAQSVDNFEPGIQKALYKYALATCLGYSHLRDDKAFGDTKSNIDEQSARNYEWFNDTPAIGTTKTTLDVFGGIGISKFGGSGVDDYGRAQCSNTAFIASAVKAIGYNAPSGDANTVFQVLCDFGFRRSGGDGCLSGNGSWDRRNLGSEDAARDAFLNSPKAKAVPDLTPAQLYWLGLNTFVTACNATITPPGGANVSEGTVKIKTYNKDTASMVESTAAWGPNKKSYSISGTSADMYTVGVISPRSTNYAPNIISAGQVLQTSVRIGNQINGCVDFAKWVNQYADAYAAWRIENPDFVGSADPLLGCSADAAGCDSPTTCVIEAVGWIVCPVMNFTAGIVDAAYSFVTALLKVQPLLTTGGTAGIYNAWVVMRNIANIAFVIVFLFIIFSQLTSMGVSNYGVKKLLPRLVIAAILVNVSFWICAIAVDLSNIIGSSMLQVFQVVEVAIPNEASTGIGGSGDGWQGIVGGLLAGTIAAGTIYYVGLSALIPALLAALVAIITVFLVLTLRQALIILLIVIAPLAFVAYLLPNTEGWFTKWRKLLMTLLLMYPIIALIFGASALASQIVMSTAGGNIVIQIMGACIAIVPLALTPLVMKTAGGLLNRFGGIVNNAEKGPIDRLRKTGEKYREGRVNLRNSRALNGEKQLGRSSFIKWRARRSAIAGGREGAAKEAKRDYVNETLGENPLFATAVAAGDTEKGQRLAVKAQAAAEAEDLKEAFQPLLRQLASMQPDDKRNFLNEEIAAGGARQAAAIQYSAQIGDTGFLRQHLAGDGGVDRLGNPLPAHTGTGQDNVVRNIREAINSNASAVTGKAPDLVKGAGAAFGSVKGEELVQYKPDTAKAYMDHLSTLHTASIAPTATAADVAKFNTALNGFNSAVEDISKSPELQGKFSAEVGIKLVSEARSKPFHQQLTGLAGVQADGKIR